MQVVGGVLGHAERRGGRESRKFISAGASVPGVIWKTIRTPSTISSWPVWVMSTVGAISETRPCEVVRPSPAPTWPARSAVELSLPYM